MIRMALVSVFASVAAACTTVPDAAAPIAIPRESGSVMWPGLNPLAHDHVNRRLDQIEALPALDGGVLLSATALRKGRRFMPCFPN